MKDKKVIAIVIVFVLAILSFAYWKATAEKPTDWTPTFVNKDKIPYGTYITYTLLKDVFPEGKVRTTRKTIYTELQEYFDRPMDSVVISYVFVSKKFTIDRTGINYLLDFVEEGNNVFISAEYIEQRLLDSLHISAYSRFNKKEDVFRLRDLPKRQYQFKNLYQYLTLNSDSTSRADGVEGLAFGENKDTVFMKVPFGDGVFYIHTQPVAFTNVEMLKLNQYDFASRCLSYLPRNSEVIWDEYQKLEKDYSIFRVINSSRALKTALIIIGVGVALFMLFRSKRIQRIIPIVKPPRNSSLEFLYTISNLYYGKRDYKTIVDKRFFYFLDQIRNNYYLRTENIDNEFMTTLSLKSGVDISILENLFHKYRKIKDSAYLISNTDFIEFNELLEEFYKESNSRKK